MEGKVTLEDLLEEIVGDIDDEYDEEVREQIKRDGESYILDGMLAVRDANKHFGLALAEDGRYTTIAGYLLDRPVDCCDQAIESKMLPEFLVVERVENRRISRVRFRPSEN